MRARGLIVLIAIWPACAIAALLAPAGKWVIDDRDYACVLSRTFGEGKEAITLGVEPFPLSASATLMLATRSHGRAPSKDEARLTLSPSNEQIRSDSTSVPAAVSGKQITSLSIERAELGKLARSKVVTVSIGRRDDISLAPTSMQAALTALSACEKNLLRSWGIPPDAVFAMMYPSNTGATLPTDSSTAHRWVTDLDYPVSALAKGAGGTTIARWTIGIDGRVHDCTVVKSAGDTALDKAACTAITSRGRYRPALDKDGKPVISWAIRKVRWRAY